MVTANDSEDPKEEAKAMTVREIAVKIADQIWDTGEGPDIGDMGIQTVIKALDDAYAEGFKAAREQLEKMIPTRPEFNMLATITFQELQQRIRSLSPEREP